MTDRVVRIRRLAGLALVVLSLLLTPLLSGCVSVPTAGKVEKVEQAPPLERDRSEVVPKPPLADAQPRLIVEGFLLAMTRFEPNYAVARQFLSANKREAWRPEDKVTIFDDRKLTSTTNQAVLTVTLTGELDADGAYAGRTGTLVHDFGMIKERGQWRISNPPDGLLISQESFSSAFTPYNLYFFDPTFSALVPDPIFLPTEGRTEASLMQALLNGPSSGLRSAVTTALPPKTKLNTNSVPVVDGIAQVSLSNAVSTLNDQQRSNLVAQICWTLRQQTVLRGVQLSVGGDPFATPDQITQNNQTFVPIDAGDQKSPISPQASTNLIGLAGKNVVTVDESGGGAALRNVPGPFGKGSYAVDSLAISTSGQIIGAVTDRATTLRRGPITGQPPDVLVRNATGLLRPQFTRYDEAWEIGRQGKKPTIWTIADASKPSPRITLTRPSWLNELSVTAFRISPDGCRLAVIGKRGATTVLALATIIRGDQLRIGPLRPIALSDSSDATLTEVSDVGWVSPTELMILASTGRGAVLEPYGVAQDGSRIERIGSADGWRATSLATAIEPAQGFRAVVVGADGHSWSHRSGDIWPPFSDKLRDPAYPG